jgi:hypothetical protein
MLGRQICLSARLGPFGVFDEYLCGGLARPMGRNERSVSGRQGPAQRSGGHPTAFGPIAVASVSSRTLPWPAYLPTALVSSRSWDIHRPCHRLGACTTMEKSLRIDCRDVITSHSPPCRVSWAFVGSRLAGRRPGVRRSPARREPVRCAEGTQRCRRSAFSSRAGWRFTGVNEFVSEMSYKDGRLMPLTFAAGSHYAAQQCADSVRAVCAGNGCMDVDERVACSVRWGVCRGGWSYTRAVFCAAAIAGGLFTRQSPEGEGCAVGFSLLSLPAVQFTRSCDR